MVIFTNTMYKLAKIYDLRSREQPKSAPYLRLKSSKRTSKCRSMVNWGPKKSHNVEKLKEGTFWDFSTSILSENIKKLKVAFGEKISPGSISPQNKHQFHQTVHDENQNSL